MAGKMDIQLGQKETVKFSFGWFAIFESSIMWLCLLTARFSRTSKRVRWDSLFRKKEIEMKNVIILVGAESIGQAIARRIGAGKQILLSDLRQENADTAAKVLSNAGF